MKDWDDSQIIEYLEQNNGEIEFEGVDPDAALPEIINESPQIKVKEVCGDEPLDWGSNIVADINNWQSKTWYHEIKNNSIDEMEIYNFDEL